jgi:uncharacterized repeat protein (TIGR04076 family)
MRVWTEKRMNKYRVTISADKLTGTCPLYEPGQQVACLTGWYFEAQPAMKLCSHALAAMLTALGPFSRGVSARELGFGKEHDVAYMQCPDPGTPYTCGGTVTFRLEREPMRLV